MNDAFLTPPASGRGDLQMLGSCPVCQTAYQPAKTRIVGQQGDDHLVFLECRQCGCGVVAVVTTGAMGIDSIGALTDLTSDELTSLGTHTSVTDDDVVELHCLLQHEPLTLLTPRREKVIQPS